MRSKLPAYGTLALASLGWSTAPVFIRYLSGAYDPFSQAAFRYACAAGFLIAYSLVFHRKGLLDAFRAPGPTIGLAVTNAFMQTCWTLGLYHTTATLGQLINKTQVVMVILLSFFVFHDERAIIRSPRFILGTLLGMVGACGVLIENPSASWIPTINLAAGLLFASAFGWAIYAVWGKHTVVHRLHPVPMFTVVSIYTSLGLGVLSALFGHPETILAASAMTTVLAVISGILPIAIAHSAFHDAQKYLGSAFCGSILLLNPLVTHLLALMLWKDEAMRWVQWVGTAFLLGGSLLVIFAERNASGNRRNVT